MIEFEPTPTVDTFRDKDEIGCYHDGEIEFALERTTVESLYKNMFRAFDGGERGYFNKGWSWVTKSFKDISAAAGFHVRLEVSMDVWLGKASEKHEIYPHNPCT